MQQRVNVTIVFEATTPEGALFTRNMTEYPDVPYRGLLMMEEAMLKAGLEMNAFGHKMADAAEAEAKKAK